MFLDLAFSSLMDILSIQQQTNLEEIYGIIIEIFKNNKSQYQFLTIEIKPANMNKMTSKEYLIDITLISLDVGPQKKAASKVLCQIHYGDGDTYLKIKLQPLVKNGIASFYQERLRIPYSSEIALVFKMFRAKKQIFLGHYTIQIQKYLQQKVYSAKLKQKLQQTDAWVDFEVKIIDKQLFCDEQSDDLEDQNVFPTNKSQYSEQQKSKANFSDYKAKSDINAPFLIIKRQQQIRPIQLPEEFGKMLLSVQDLLKKHRIAHAKNQNNLDKIKRNQQTQSSTIFNLRLHIKQSKQNQKINNYILWLSVALVGLFVGFALKN